MAPGPQVKGGAARAGRLLGLLAALWVTVPGVLHPLNPGWLSGVNLIFHEAGHMLLMFAGETLMLLGGSLLQLLVPGACAAAFLWRGDRFAAGLTTLWLAHSLSGVAAYIRDAPRRDLPLITGDPDTHDWWQLLGGWNALDAADPLGRFVLFLAYAAVVGGVLLALWDEVAAP
ncbi:hypothetical protein [Deinococcus multiflagellatus]|uniref:Uncharacterized protein n=1 Tax=Deinococcus multiflagellatus TaxID=1656887 RepID=A0ABW1ZFK1_9DEIO|nr:hypothetical protein [Deinococcus multiflagellatus]MBZ9711982.1 hypothetical protein [Deinococcus multiflagellatus]